MRAQDKFLGYSPEQHPIVLQIGGSKLENLAKATELANAYNYDEINFKFVPFLYMILFTFLFALHFFSLNRLFSLFLIIVPAPKPVVGVLAQKLQGMGALVFVLCLIQRFVGNACKILNDKLIR